MEQPDFTQVLLKSLHNSSQPLEVELEMAVRVSLP